MANESNMLWELSEDDRAVIRRFGLLIMDNGMQAALHIRAAQQYSAQKLALHESLSSATRNVRTITEDFSRPDQIFRAAPALHVLVDWMTIVSLVPRDFLPSKELVDRCLKAFFDSIRSRAADPGMT